MAAGAGGVVGAEEAPERAGCWRQLVKGVVTRCHPALPCCLTPRISDPLLIETVVVSSRRDVKRQGCHGFPQRRKRFRPHP